MRKIRETVDVHLRQSEKTAAASRHPLVLTLSLLFHEKKYSHERGITTSNSYDSLEHKKLALPQELVSATKSVPRDDIYLRRPLPPPPIWNRSNPRVSRMHNRALFIIRDVSRVEMLIGSFLLRIRQRYERREQFRFIQKASNMFFAACKTNISHIAQEICRMLGFAIPMGTI